MATTTSSSTSEEEELSSSEILESLHDIDEVRSLRFDDYEKGYLELVGSSQEEISYSEFILSLTQLHQNRNHTIWVIEDIHINKLIACATLFLEPKLGSRRYTKKAYIQDLVILPEYVKYGFDVKLMKFLRKMAKKEGCYELSISCPREKCSFYQRHGFSFSRLELTSTLT